MEKYMRLKMLKDLKGDDKPFYAYVVEEKQKGNYQYEKEFLVNSKVNFKSQMGGFEEFKKRWNDFAISVKFFPLKYTKYDSSLNPYDSYNLDVVINVNEHLFRDTAKTMMTFNVEFLDNDTKGYLEYCIDLGFMPKSIYDIVISKLIKDYNFTISHVMVNRNKYITHTSYKYDYDKNTFFEITK